MTNNPDKGKVKNMSTHITVTSIILKNKQAYHQSQTIQRSQELEFFTKEFACKSQKSNLAIIMLYWRLCRNKKMLDFLVKA